MNSERSGLLTTIRLFCFGEIRNTLFIVFADTSLCTSMCRVGAYVRVAAVHLLLLFLPPIPFPLIFILAILLLKRWSFCTISIWNVFSFVFKAYMQP